VVSFNLLKFIMLKQIVQGNFSFWDEKIFFKTLRLLLLRIFRAWDFHSDCSSKS
jgi:hypothetical protein